MTDVPEAPSSSSSIPINALLTERIERMMEQEIRSRINKYAHIISKKHDISLKLLLRDVDLVFSEKCDTDQCKGITKKKTQCLSRGRHNGCVEVLSFTEVPCSHRVPRRYCMTHSMQRKIPVLLPALPAPPVAAQGAPPLTATVEEDQPPMHVGHVLQECLYLPGCPACEVRE
jgi:hypothetical protein